jgi:hypothetical protein
MDKITTKELQWTLKVTLNKISKQDFSTRLDTVNYAHENITKIQKSMQKCLTETYLLLINLQKLLHYAKNV